MGRAVYMPLRTSTARFPIMVQTPPMMLEVMPVTGAAAGAGAVAAGAVVVTGMVGSKVPQPPKDRKPAKASAAFAVRASFMMVLLARRAQA
jgi:hypothetical protein